jgi:HK97 family phage major capsid protein
MNKLQELRQKLTGQKEEVRTLLDDNKVEDAETKMEEVRALEKQIAIEEELEEQETRKLETEKEKREIEIKGDTKVEERAAFIKALRGLKMTEEERALVQGGENEDGGYLVPTDVATQIEELKREYKSAKGFTDVVPTSTRTGSFPVEQEGNVTELVHFTENNDGLSEDAPKFRNVSYDIQDYGVVTPIANSFLQDEQGGFLNYLNRNFAKRAIKTENKKIFDVLKAGNTAKTVSDVDGIKEVFNKDLDAAIADSAIVIANQTAFQYLDEMKDENGRPLLQDNPGLATGKMLQGRAVEVFNDSEIPAVAGRGVLYVGSIADAVKFFDRGVYEVAISKEAGFTKHQTLAKVVERFDVKLADKSAYVHVQVEQPTDAPAGE